MKYVLTEASKEVTLLRTKIKRIRHVLDSWDAVASTRLNKDGTDQEALGMLKITQSMREVL